MAIELKMPKLGMTMTEGIITKWNKEVGETVHKGEQLYEVETDKVNIEIESTVEGVLLKTIAEKGDTVPVGGIVCYIGEPNETIVLPDEKAASENSDQPDIEKNKQTIKTIKPFFTYTGTKIPATPAARNLAKKEGVDLSSVTGSGVNGKITRKDVENVISEKNQYPREPAAQEQGYDYIKTTHTQKIMANRMTESFSGTPHFYLSIEADVTKSMALLKDIAPRIQSETGIKATFTDILIWLLGKAISENPRINASWNNGEILASKAVNIGIATAVNENLVVPVVTSAATKTLKQITLQRSELITRARSGKSLPEDYACGTFTLSNLGMYGIKNFQGIINPPQSALLSVGTILDKAVVIDKNIVIRPMIEMSLSCDHRVIDGAAGAKFLARLKAILEEPEKLMESLLL